MTAYWKTFEVTYRNLDSPLKPCAEDAGFIEETLAQWRTHRAPAKFEALLCGVTPVLANLKLPDGTRLLAVEQSESMIEAIWPGDTATRTVARGNWLDLPIPSQSFDIVLGDGCFNCMDYPLGYRRLFDSLHRVLARDGIMFMRFFMRPREREEVDMIFDDLFAGTIANFHIFKWRLAMALQESTAEGIAVSRIHDAWATRGIHPSDLATALNWPQAAVETIDNYQGKDTRLSFPTEDEIRAAIPDGLKEALYKLPSYKLGERCPMFVFMPR